VRRRKTARREGECPARRVDRASLSHHMKEGVGWFDACSQGRVAFPFAAEDGRFAAPLYAVVGACVQRLLAMSPPPSAAVSSAGATSAAQACMTPGGGDDRAQEAGGGIIDWAHQSPSPLGCGGVDGRCQIRTVATPFDQSRGYLTI